MRALPHHHRSRARLLALAAALGAFGGLLAGGSTARASALAFETPTLQVTVTPTTAMSDQGVTLTAVVTATTAYPDGTITFATLDDQSDPIGGAPVPLQRVSDLQSKATLTTTFAANTYAIVAFFTPTPAETQSFTFFATDTRATPIVLQVSAAAPTPVPTHTTLEVSPLPVLQGQRESLTAHVTADSGPAPTGGQVYFWDGTGRIGQTTLVNGVATVTDVGSFGPGPHELSATYDGNPPLWAGSASPGTSFSVVDTTPQPTTTHTTLTVSPSTIHAGETVDLVAHVTQAGGALAPPGDRVFFYASSDCLNGALGSAPVDDNGDATLRGIASWSVEDYTLCASYVGNTFKYIEGSGATAQLRVVGPSSPTTLTLTGPSTADYGTDVTFAVHLADSAGAVAGKKVTIAFGAQSCSPSTDASGNAQCTFTANDTTVSTLTASFAGDLVDDPSSATHDFAVTLTSTMIPTTLQYTGATTGDFGDDVTLSALLRDSSQHPVGGRTVTLTLGTQSCDATTASDGTASCTVTIAQPAGTIDAGAHFAADDPYLASDASDVPFKVTREEAVLGLSAPAAVVSGDTVTLAATLREDGAGAIAGRSLTFTFGSATCAANTGADGTATCTLTASGSGAIQARVSFAGDDEYAAPSDATAQVLVQLRTTLTYTGPTSGDYDDGVAVSAHLADQTGAPVANAPVTFTLGSRSCTGSTSTSGDASCSLTPDGSAGSATLHVTYGGDGSILLPSGADPTFTVTREETTLSLAAPAAAQEGSAITLTATLLEDGTAPIDGRTITFAYGADTCTATTSGGIATCQIDATALGPVPVRASFAADAYYDAATSAARTLYVYAPTPGGGMFVVGDESAAGNVTFWGDQWWKANSLSAGAAPSSFKGYALHASTTCDGSWSTDPGNSTPPPARTLPAYIAVVVASSAAKSGAAISGREVHVVVVKTSPGYDGDPGHTGTGTVVATVC